MSNEERQETKGEFEVYERIRIGDREIEVRGPESYVKRRIEELMRQASQNVQPSQSRVIEQQNAPQIIEVSGSQLHEIVEPQHTLSDIDKKNLQPNSLIEFYLNKSPKTQGDQILVVTYYYQKFLGREHISLEDYEEGFKALKRAAVKEPSNYKSSVRNVVDRTNPKLLYNPERGQFSLTLQGERYVENIKSNNEE